jgi:FPC/CPF motif-containing protein YcgG
LGGTTPQVESTNYRKRKQKENKRGGVFVFNGLDMFSPCWHVMATREDKRQGSFFFLVYKDKEGF